MSKSTGSQSSTKQGVASGNESLSSGNTGGPMRNQSLPGGHGVRYTRFVFTLNNWTQVEYDWLTGDFTALAKWMMIGKETCPRTKTPHLQGAVVLKKQTARSTIAKMTGFKRAWHHTMDGTPEQSYVYCSKEDKNKFEHGILPNPGKRNDLHDVTEQILAGKQMVEIVRESVPAASVYVRYHQGLHRLRNLLSKKRVLPPKVYWIYGPTGVHKTRIAHEFGPKLGWDDSRDFIWTTKGDLKWFDGYDGQPIALFDDLRAKQVQFAFLLRLLDRYDLDVPIKGGFAHWVPKIIIITTPKDPKETFETRWTHKPEDIDQLTRRITLQFHIPKILSDQERETLLERMLIAGGFETKDAPQGSDSGEGTASVPILIREDAQLFPDDVEVYSEPENEEELSLESYNSKVLPPSQGDINSDLSCSEDAETLPFALNTQELFSGASSESKD